MASDEEDPFIASLRAAQPSVLFPSPSPSTEAGKSSGGGFLGKESSEEFPVSGTVNRDEVPIVVLNAKDLRDKYCGGLIGRAANRACLEENCDIQSHRAKKLEIPNDSAYLFIQVKDQAVIYTKPYITPDALEPHLERYLADTRSVQAWETLFQSIALQPAEGRKPEEVERLVKHIDGDKVAYGMTPLKKRARFESDTGGMEAGFQLPNPELQEGLDPSNIAFAAEFPVQWQALVKSLKQLTLVIQSVRNHVLEVTQATDDELDSQAYTVSKLANLVGTRPNNLGTMTVFDCIREAGLELDALVNKVSPQRLDNLELHLQRHHPTPQADFKKQVLAQMVNSLDPVFKLFNGLSSTPASPGDLLAHEFQKIQTELASLKRQQATPPAPTSTPSAQFPWSLGLNQSGGAAQVPLPAAGASINTSIDTRITMLDSKVKAIETQLEANRVDMGGEAFKSRDEVKAWIQTEAGHPGSFVYFVDAHSLLSLATEHASSNTEVIQLQMNASRSGMGSSDEALVLSGFRLELPTFFGRDGSVNEAVQDTRVLPGVKKFVDWDPPGGHSGARRRLERQIGSKQKQLTTNTNFYLSSKGMVVANEMINQSARFLQTLGTWMSQHYLDLTGKGSNAENVWKLISHSVRAVFMDLHMARMPGRGPFTDGDEIDKAAGVMWGSLQAHSKMSEYLDAGFSSHPRLSHILNVHLQEHAVMKHDLADVLARLTDVEKAASAAQSTADSAKALAKKK